MLISNVYNEHFKPDLRNVIVVNFANFKYGNTMAYWRFIENINVSEQICSPLQYALSQIDDYHSFMQQIH